jgi:hypothetical protein
MSEIREPLLSESAERLFALEQHHQIAVLDRDELGAVTAPTQSNRLLNGLLLTSVGLAEAAWFASLVYLGARLLL